MRGWLAAAALALALGAGSAVAQDDGDGGTSQSAAQSRAAQFRAVRGATRENVPGGPLLLAAYGVAWLLVLGYVVRLGVMHARTARDLERLERSVSGKPAPAPGPAPAPPPAAEPKDAA